MIAEEELVNLKSGQFLLIYLNSNWRWFLTPIRYLEKYLGKDPNAGKDWKQEKRVAENEMAK